jgi:hypothetical protein
MALLPPKRGAAAQSDLNRYHGTARRSMPPRPGKVAKTQDS